MRISLTRIVVIKTVAILLAFTGAPLVFVIPLFFGADVWLAYHLFIPGASGFARTSTRFETQQPEVWLTIDDGPDPEDTPLILELLDRHQARATFFLIGERAARHPKLVAEIARRGHEIGHHTHTHPSGTFWCSSPEQIACELDAALPYLSPSETPRPRRFRAPVGIKNPFLAAALAQRNLRCIAWSVRSHDAFARNPARVIARVLRQARPGAIILLHEGPGLHPRVRVHALAGVLAGLTQRGLRCVLPDDAQLR